MNSIVFVSSAFIVVASQVVHSDVSNPLRTPPVPEYAAGFERREAYEKALMASPTKETLRAWHELLASEPHVAGTEGDWKVIGSIENEFKKMGAGLDGWTVEVDEFWAYLSRPVAAELEIVGPDSLKLELREKPVAFDPAAAKAAGEFAYLAYSGSGEVTGEIVYANYGTKADFATLKKLGVDLKGKIVLCRFGGNYRGYKVKFAEEAGAAGLLIFTDPGDAGFVKGDVYPTGTWSNECCIQRGSLLVTGYQGDPLTPGVPATKDAKRLDPKDVSLPKIPAQPIGYGAATEIIRRMKGEKLPEDLKAWVGGIRADYLLTGGPELKVRLKVEQKRELVRTANVIATLRGRGPEQAEIDREVIIGCHHDAWNCGAADPTCGTIAMLAAAKAFAEQAKAGTRPVRSVTFAAWGAEEHGIIGSSEWVEKHRERLAKNGVAYFNLDMASMGPNFGSAASPELKTVIAEVAKVVPQARDAAKTVYEDWAARSGGEPSLGDLGGGSDHVAFLMHAGVPSASMSAGGSKGNSYHSAYDTLPWYWKTVGDDYEPALMVSRMTTVAAARLADAPVIPYDLARVRAEFAKHVEGFRGSKVWPAEGQAAAIEELLKAVAGSTAGAALTNDERVRETRRFMRDAGVPGRRWFKNWYVATDENSGYATWVLPGFRKAAEDEDAKAFAEAARVYLEMWR